MDGIINFVRNYTILPCARKVMKKIQFFFFTHIHSNNNKSIDWKSMCKVRGLSIHISINQIILCSTIIFFLCFINLFIYFVDFFQFQLWIPKNSHVSALFYILYRWHSLIRATTDKYKSKNRVFFSSTLL